MNYMCTVYCVREKINLEIKIISSGYKNVPPNVQRRFEEIGFSNGNYCMESLGFRINDRYRK